MELEYEGGVPIFRPTYDDFKDFRKFVRSIEPIGMQTGIAKIVPPKEWLQKLPRVPSSEIEKVEIRNPIIQNIILGKERGVFSIENVEKKRKYTVKQWLNQSNQLGNQPPVIKGERQKVLGQFSASPEGYVTYDDSDFTPEVLQHLSSRFWKGLAYGGAPMYGADLPGSLFNEHVNEWNVAKLDSLLSSLPDTIPGVNDAYLYCGMWRATFSWHVEDMDLPSINYIHFGAPKQWYTIPQSHHADFYNLMSTLWPEEHVKCSEFLRHKTFLVDPSYIRKHGIPVNEIVHRQQEFIITFPHGYHAGFNYGFNIAESVNFAHESWLKFGVSAKKCHCVAHSVGIDVQRLISLYESQSNSTLSLTKESKLLIPSKPKRAGKCILCPHKYNGKYISNSERTARVHPVCANLIPETFTAGRTVYGLPDIEKDRFTLRCGHCKIKLGACFQCSFGSCTRSYHGSCAAAAGVDYSDVNRPLCKYHRGEDSSRPTITGFQALPGDIVQFLVGKACGAGVVTYNDRKGQYLNINLLPDLKTNDIVSYLHVRNVYSEVPTGPFIEALATSNNGKAKRGKNVTVT